jgi:hypothetical protein
VLLPLVPRPGRFQKQREQIRQGSRWLGCRFFQSTGEASATQNRVWAVSPLLVALALPWLVAELLIFSANWPGNQRKSAHLAKSL